MSGGGGTRTAATTGKTCTAVPASVHAALRSPGQRLDQGNRAFFESRFGADLSSVRVHADAHAAASADDLGALGYTAGAHIVFARGQYAPHTSAGRTLLAHELAHVLQQRSGASLPPGVSRPNDPAERQADQSAAATLRRHTARRRNARSPERRVRRPFRPRCTSSARSGSAARFWTRRKPTASPTLSSRAS